MNESKLESDIRKLISKLRKGTDTDKNWPAFIKLVEENLPSVCRELDTRWLVSICDTYVDFGDDITSRNALLVVQMVNFEKLWATNLLMYDVAPNEQKLAELKKNKVIPLWDGMYSFNINHGDMTWNLFSRMDKLIKETPVIHAIYLTLIDRLKTHDTALANLNKYHKRLFEPYPRRSVFRLLRKKMLHLFKSYKI
jgi:hypothetical protein